MRTLDEIIAMPDERRRRLRLRRKHKMRATVYEYGLQFSRDELLDYLRKNSIRSRKKLTEGRQKGEPRNSDYVREFGGWGLAIQEAFGRKLTPPDDATYFVKTVVQFKLWTFREYCAARRRDPEVIPPTRALFRRWGSFSNLTLAARQYSITVIVGDYLKLYRRLGRKPSDRECHANGINIEKAISAWTGRKHFESHIDDIIAVEESLCEKKKKSLRGSTNLAP